MLTAKRRLPVTLTMSADNIDLLTGLSDHYDKPRSRVVEDMILLAVKLAAAPTPKPEEDE